MHNYEKLQSQKMTHPTIEDCLVSGTLLGCSPSLTSPPPLLTWRESWGEKFPFQQYFVYYSKSPTIFSHGQIFFLYNFGPKAILLLKYFCYMLENLFISISRTLMISNTNISRKFQYSKKCGFSVYTVLLDMSPSIGN